MILEYDFRVIGAERVKSAMGGIEKRFVQHNARMNREMGVPARKGASATRNPELEAGRIARAQASARARAERHVYGVRQRELMRAQREEERATKAQTAARIRDEKRVAAEARRNEERLHRRRIANERIVGREVAKAERRRLSEVNRIERRQQAARDSYRRSTIGTAGRSVRGTMRAVGMAGAGALAIGGGFAATGAIQHQIDLQSAAAGLANQAYREGSGPSREELKKSVIDQAQAEGIRTGLGAEGMVRGMRQFVAISGSLPAAQAIAPFMGDIANASDSDIGDVGRTGGQIAQALIQARGLSPEDAVKETEEIMLSMAGQAKIGSIEFADLATQMGKLISSTARFDGEVADLASTMGAVGQLAIAGGASSPEEAMTSILRFSDDIVQNHKKFSKLGVDVFADAGKTKMNSPESILFDMIEKSEGDLTKIKNVFGIRAMKAAEPFQKLFTESGGGYAGREAIENRLSEFKGTKLTREELRESASFRATESDRELTRLAEEFKSAVGTQLLPALTEMIPQFREMIPQIAQMAKSLAGFVSWMLDNPFKGIGAIVAGKLVADIAAAKIGQVMVAAMMGGGAPMGGAAGMAGGAAAVAGGGRGKGRAPMSRGQKFGMGVGLAGMIASTLYMADDALNHVPTEPEAGGTDLGIQKTREAMATVSSPEETAKLLAASQERDAFLQKELSNTQEAKENPFMQALNEGMFRNLWDPEYQRARDRAGAGIGDDGSEEMAKLKEQIAKSAEVTAALTAKMGSVSEAMAGLTLNRSNSPTLPR